MGMIDWIERLEGIREQRGWTNKRLARELRITESYWSLLRRRMRTPGAKLIGCALKRFPGIVRDAELQAFILPEKVAGRQP